ncbi:MAG: outer membrane beta-barrel domain-containing protein [Deltaproteobacteria bacterium]|nr:outer membrane beta-barrel domain-containing protein [Deltaproteobacteria bacterium]
MTRVKWLFVPLLLGAAIALVLPLSVARAAESGAPTADKKDDQKADDGNESGREDRLEDRTRRLGDRIKSVQRKAFIKRNRHELSVNGGLSLNDAFYQQFTVGGGYTYHITEHFALEANFKYFLPPLRTDAVRIVRTTESATPILIYSPQLSITGELQFAPIYGKISLMAEAIIHFDVYIAAGFGVVMTEERHPGDGSPWRALGTAAIGARIMTTDWLTIRAEIRDQIYQDTRTSSAARPNENAIQNMLTFNLGVSFFLPPSFDYRYE